MADKWIVTSQNLDQVLSDTGTGFEKVWQVNYKVTEGPAKGTRGHVVIPVAEYSADTVFKTISAAVYHVDQVAGL